jgi:hypothetical protein
MGAMPIWILAVWLSGCLAAMRSPNALRQRIHCPAVVCLQTLRGFALIQLLAWYPVQRFQNARPSCRVAHRVSFLAIAAGQSFFHGHPFLRIGMIAAACRSIPLSNKEMHCRAMYLRVAAAGVIGTVRSRGADIFTHGIWFCISGTIGLSPSLLG